MRRFFIFIFVGSLFVSGAWALTITDGTASNGRGQTNNTYEIRWTDNDGSERMVSLNKSDNPDDVGVSCLLEYYIGGEKVSITPGNPGEGYVPLSYSFGSTTHHGASDHHFGGTLTLVHQSDSRAVFDWVSNVDGSTETVTYVFQDGLDYFMWNNTLNSSGHSGDAGDSRGPYCTMKWHGGSDFGALDGQQYVADKHFSQPTYNNSWTFTDVSGVKIPFVHAWKSGKEVGYIQTQTFSQQLAGNPTSAASLNMGSSGSSIGGGTTDSPNWQLDFQMNSYDGAQKITWGLPYGYTSGSSDAGCKNGWGQYALAIVFDGQSEGGVERIVNENKAIHGGQVTLTAATGTVKTQGPVGTRNPATQTLSPAGYDHNHRSWWVDAAGDEADITLAVSGSTPLVNPVFRISNLSAAPSAVSHNGSTLDHGNGCYISYDETNTEAWITIEGALSGSNQIVIGGVQSTGLSVSGFAVSPSSVVNDQANEVTFSAVVTDDGSVSGVTLDLSALGGSSSQAMTAAGDTYSYTLSIAQGAAAGNHSITLTATDNESNTRSASTSLVITAPISAKVLYDDANELNAGVGWVGDGAGNVSSAEEVTTDAYEGSSSMAFNYTVGGGWAGYGIAWSNWNTTVSAVGYTTFSFAHKGAAGQDITLVFAIGDNEVSLGTVPGTSDWTVSELAIPASGQVSGIGAVNIIVGGGDGTGTLYVDMIQLTSSGTPVMLPDRFAPSMQFNRAGEITARVFSLSGELVATLGKVHNRRDAVAAFNRKVAARGTYLIQLQGIDLHERFTIVR